MKNSGIIVNVNSAGEAGFENLSSYCAGKFGLMGLAKSVALEADPYKIRIMTTCPGEWIQKCGKTLILSIMN
jgi:NAD(P)-dependent dehydrogenase (short-subunit alcohol dehydrogenase family)